MDEPPRLRCIGHVWTGCNFIPEDARCQHCPQTYGRWLQAQEPRV